MMSLQVLSSHAVQEVLRELRPVFERTSGFRVTIDYDPANALKRRIEGGSTFDVVIATRPVIDGLVKHRDIRRETCVDVAQSGLGVVVRKGAPKPDVTTLEAFRRTLLATDSVVRSKEGTSGLYFEALLIRLGIAEAMRDKIVLGGSGRIAELVARGEVNMAVQQIPELLPVDGVEFVGPLPDDLQLRTIFSAGVSTNSKTEGAAKAFVESLAAPTAFELLKLKGFEPITC